MNSRQSDNHPAPQAELLEKIAVTRMPYGKYKGRLLLDLPDHYLDWFARVGFPPGSLGLLLAALHEIRLNGLGKLLEPLRPGRAAG